MSTILNWALRDWFTHVLNILEWDFLNMAIIYLIIAATKCRVTKRMHTHTSTLLLLVNLCCAV